MTTLLSRHPDLALKIFTMSEYATGKSTDIADAFGQPEDAFRETLSQIQFYITKMCDRFTRS